MAEKKLSRINQVEVDYCASIFENKRYDMILAAARRARQLQKKADPWTNVTPIDALLEIQEGKLTLADCRGSMIGFDQKKN